MSQNAIRNIFNQLSCSSYGIKANFSLKSFIRFRFLNIPFTSSFSIAKVRLSLSSVCEERIREKLLCGNVFGRIFFYIYAVRKYKALDRHRHTLIALSRDAGRMLESLIFLHFPREKNSFSFKGFIYGAHFW